jgi:outer membrane protein assembly factor BamE (lipoprotein component of BamABCDE complex)
VAVIVGGCSFFQAPEVTHGNRVDPDVLKELTPGTSTRTDVVALIGSPTTKATFDDKVWVYIGQRTRTRIFRTIGVVDQDVVLLTFDDQGTLRDIRTLTTEDGKDVAMASGSTPSPGSEATFMQQLLGNVGRFSGGQLPGSSSSGAGTGGGTGLPGSSPGP